MEKKDSDMYTALSFAWELGFYIVIPVGVFVFLGFFADRRFATKPLFLFAGLVIGISIAGYQAHRFIAPFLRDDKKDDK